MAPLVTAKKSKKTGLTTAGSGLAPKAKSPRVTPPGNPPGGVRKGSTSMRTFKPAAPAAKSNSERFLRARPKPNELHSVKELSDTNNARSLRLLKQGLLLGKSKELATQDALTQAYELFKNALTDPEDDEGLANTIEFWELYDLWDLRTGEDQLKLFKHKGSEGRVMRKIQNGDYDNDDQARERGIIERANKKVRFGTASTGHKTSLADDPRKSIMKAAPRTALSKKSNGPRQTASATTGVSKTRVPSATTPQHPVAASKQSWQPGYATSPGRGTVVSATNPPTLVIDGREHPNPLFETMPTKEVWYRRMPPFFAFGETSKVEKMKSDQIKEDLASDEDQAGEADSGKRAYSEKESDKEESDEEELNQSEATNSDKTEAKSSFLITTLQYFWGYVTRDTASASSQGQAGKAKVGKAKPIKQPAPWSLPPVSAGQLQLISKIVGPPAAVKPASKRPRAESSRDTSRPLAGKRRAVS